jgi:hypothetical protein
MRAFGKVWNPGDKIRVFHPLYIEKDPISGDEMLSIVSAAEWVHRIDAKALHLGGIFSGLSMASRDPETGKPTGFDALAKMARIARELLRIEKEAAEKKIANNTRLTEEARVAAMKGSEEEFKNRQPVISGARLVNIIEVVAVPLTSAGVPDMARAAACYMDVSEKRGDALLKILDGGRYYIDMEHKLLEVEYVMGTSGTRSQDAQVTPDGIMEKESLAAAFPEVFAELLAGPISALPDTAEIIYKRNPSFREAEERRVLNGFSQYLSINGDMLDLMETDEDALKALKNSADLMVAMGIKVNTFDIHEEAARLAAEADGGLLNEKPDLDESRSGSFDEEIAQVTPDDDDKPTPDDSQAPPPQEESRVEEPASERAPEPESPAEPEAPAPGAPGLEDLGI